MQKILKDTDNDAYSKKYMRALLKKEFPELFFTKK